MQPSLTQDAPRRRQKLQDTGSGSDLLMIGWQERVDLTEVIWSGIIKQS